VSSSTPLFVLQWALLAFFLIPTIEAAMMILGAVWAQFRYAQAPEKFQYLLIQITTVGKEPELVQLTVNKIRSYCLPMPYEIWVAIEPDHFDKYENVDRVVVVPTSFTCRAIDKARALEYSRRLRAEFLADRGLDPATVKLLLVDDDTLPSRSYVHKAFAGDYDVCQGPTIPNRWYGTGGFRHFILSHLDNIRTRNCLIYCSCTQGITQKPLFVHGEGLCMTCRAESIVTWDKPIVASDDLVFGTTAAHKGLSWGYFQGAAIQLVSPWSFGEILTQRRRWTWGNFDAIRSREIMPQAPAIFRTSKYLLTLATIISCITGVILLGFGIAKVPAQARYVFWGSLFCWAASYGLTGWINSGGEPNRERLGPRKIARDDYSNLLTYQLASFTNIFRRARINYWAFRFFQTVSATVLAPVTALTPLFVTTYSVLKGRPTRFEVIAKSNTVMDRGLA
jgi:Glycosyl transferase family group 2